MGGVGRRCEGSARHPLERSVHLWNVDAALALQRDRVTDGDAIGARGSFFGALQVQHGPRCRSRRAETCGRIHVKCECRTSCASEVSVEGVQSEGSRSITPSCDAERRKGHRGRQRGRDAMDELEQRSTPLRGSLRS